MKPKSTLRSFAAACALIVNSSAYADTFYYDGGGTTTTANGWGTNTFWSTNLAGTADPVGAPGLADDVIFSITGAADGVVGMNAARAANSITFSSGAANTLQAHTTTTTANSLTIGTGGITVNSGAGAVTFGTSTRGILTTTLNTSQSWTHGGSNLFSVTQAVSLGANTLTLAGGGTGGTTIGGVIGGAGAVTIDRSGSGLVTLSGANTFSGQLTVARGTLAIGSINNVSAAGTLGNNALGVILGGSGTTGTLQYTGATATSTKPFTMATGGTSVFDVSTAATSLTLSGVISGGGGLTKTGAGRLILVPSANNTYSGLTSVQGGVLRFGNGFNNSWNGATFSLPSGGGLEINNGIVEAWYYKTFSSGLGSGANQIQLTGGRSGFTNLQSDATATWLTIGTTGTTVTWGPSTFAPTSLVLNDVGAQAVLRVANPVDLNGAARTVEVAATGVGAGRGTYGVFERALSGAGGSLVKTGAGTLMLDGANTYGAGTNINAGGLWFNRKTAMPASGAVVVGDGAVICVTVDASTGWTTGTSGNGTIGGLLAGLGGQAGGTVTYTGNVGVGFNVTSSSRTYAGDIADVTGSTTTSIHAGNKDGGTASDPFPSHAGTLVLSGNNSYTGTTFVNRGILQAGSANALGNGGDITFRGGTLQLTASSAANSYGSRIKNSTGAIAIDTNGQNFALSGISNTNTGGLAKSGAGILTLSGANSYTGATTLSGGSITFSNGTVNSQSVTLSANNTTMSILGGGVSSTWNLGNQDLTATGTPTTNIQLVIDGAGTAGSAVVTNVANLVWGRTTNSSGILLKDGGQMSVNAEVRIGNPYYSTTGGNTLTIQGGTATSTFTGNTAQAFYIGYGERPGATNNVVTVSSGGVLTSIGHVILGELNNTQNGDTLTSGNKLAVTGTGTASVGSISVGYIRVDAPVSTIRRSNANVVEVTAGGLLTSSGVVYIGRANNISSNTIGNTATVTGAGSSWNAGNQNIFVGHTNSATAVANNNILTVGAGGVVSNVAALTVGFGTGTETGNQLVVNGSLTAASVTVSSGNSMSGNGTINGPVTVNGTVAPGTSIGTLSVTGNTTIAGTLQIEVDGSSVDLLAITGNANISAATLSIVPIGAGATQPSYTLLTYTGTLTPASGPFFAEGTLPVGYSIDYSTPGQIRLVSASNTAPTITDIANLSIPSGTNTGALAFTVGDMETAAGSLNVTATSDNLTLVPNANISLGGSGASRNITVTPVSGLFGSALITVTVSDGLLTAQDTFTLTVTQNYLSWATANGVTGGPNGDHDNDGVNNLVEYALVNGGERGVLSGNTITFTKRGVPFGSDLTYTIETSETLGAGSWTGEVTHGPGLLISNPTISYTFTPSTPVKKFARLKVTEP